MTRSWILLLSLLLVATPSNAERPGGKLKGSYGFFGDDCDEKGKGDRCVMSFVVEGEAAKLLYGRINLKAKPDECTGGLIKDVGNGMTCYKEGSEYTCHFGYNFKREKFTDSGVTC